MTEIQLVKALKLGNQEAFDEFYNTYINISLKMAYLISGNVADSEDIVQESFIKCYQHIHKLKDERAFRAWFFRILTRTAWNYCKGHVLEVPNSNDLLQMVDELIDAK